MKNVVIGGGLQEHTLVPAVGDLGEFLMGGCGFVWNFFILHNPGQPPIKQSAAGAFL